MVGVVGPVLALVAVIALGSVFGGSRSNRAGATMVKRSVELCNSQ
jgi:hypothetical protein